MTDPLSRLVSNRQEFDRALLASALEDFVRLDPDQKSISFRAGAKQRLGNKRTILVAVLAQAALALLAKGTASGLSPKELETITAVRGNTLRPLLKGMADSNVLAKDADSRYLVLPGMLEDVVGLVLNSDAGRGE